MRRYLIICVPIFVLVGGLILGLRVRQPSSQKNDMASPSAQVSQEEGEIVVEVIMGEDGYEPNNITLKNGQAVRFINASKDKRWPASNIHPTHELYADFDPKRELNPDEKWTFTFRRKGVWRMHDHIYPYMKGIINVE